jgi:hypothetical protein
MQSMLFEMYMVRVFHLKVVFLQSMLCGMSLILIFIREWDKCSPCCVKCRWSVIFIRGFVNISFKLRSYICSPCFSEMSMVRVFH